MSVVSGDMVITVRFDKNMKADVKEWVKANFIERAAVQEAITRYCTSDRGKAQDFEDLVYWLTSELKI